MMLFRALLAFFGGGLAGMLIGGGLGYLLGLAYLRWWKAPNADSAGAGMAAFLIMGTVALLGAILGAITGLVFVMRTRP